MNILFIGCGRMGGAMARAWASDHRVLAHDPWAELPDGVEKVGDLAGADLPGDLVVILAVKPQAVGTLRAMLAPLRDREPLFVSIMAGVPLARLHDLLGTECRMVRTMPNTAAAIGRGITAAYASDTATASDRARVEALLLALGESIWLDQEREFDAVTAVSGSGPAYFFRFAEALAAAGAAEGLSPQQAMRLARATFAGAAALMESRTSPLAALRAEVTSPGGTTEAGLAVMDGENGIDRLLQGVVQAAATRSRQLAADEGVKAGG